MIWGAGKAVRLELQHQEDSVRAEVDFGGYRELDCAQSPDRRCGRYGRDHQLGGRRDTYATTL